MADTVQASSRFGGQVVVITGAATGIGRAAAIRFGSEGARVACLDIEAAANESTAEAAGVAGAETMALNCDVRSREQQESAFAVVLDHWGRIDVLVTSAGMYVGGPLPEIPLDRWENLVAVNLTGVLTSNSLVAPVMIDQGRGSIINISSMAGKTSWPNSAEYSATKSGVIGLTRSAAMELGPHGITVNAVCPGNTRTAMVEKVAVEIGATLDMTGEEWLEMRANDTALKRLAQPEEIAGVIAFLASDDARYLTGQAIEVDGGLILS
jgi:NAD(P)-dependent dehydrogenase (short-subunit alcohol dehydrogenase family)